MCDEIVSKDPFMFKYCLGRYNTQKICDKSDDAFLPTLKFVPGWFATRKNIKKLDDDLFFDGDIILVNRIQDGPFQGCPQMRGGK